ncbi:MAG: polysaccharide deacetylase family protein [Sulfurimonas sp.]|uniref:polysaccharide deacetylase family protein n=1 Tax=Sulfurimonas sp. TaxID=2022749 RepID=UPI00263426C1|nr:polysaccharide deacetylase family protein [Sulfurimonas sp.]MDD3476815.1 polysaccharide deacetylase family protein [Sulfurimonas sp.]
MLTSIMYHHVNSDRCSNELKVFEEHLKYISQNYTSLFPGEEVTSKSICLTFDDAYADFYYFIFPLLLKYDLKALLAVPTKYILDDTSYTQDVRLDFEHNDLFKNYEKATFCTFKELREMVDSGLVQIGSHSHSHVNLLEEGVDLEEELVVSKNILEEKLGIKVESFVFPFGKYNEGIAKEAHKHYQYLFRIGNAIHKDFSGIKGVIYRVNGDNLTQVDEPFSFKNRMKYRFKAFIKRF